MMEIFVNKSGSSLLTVIIIITLISLLCLNIWRMTLVAFDISLKKQQYELQIHAMQGVMQWALDICKNNFDNVDRYIKKYKQGIQVELPQWTINHKEYKIDLVFRHVQENVISLTEHIYVKNISQGNLSCSITKEFINNSVIYKVSNWSTHAV